MSEVSDFVFNIKYDYNALKLEYKTTCDALQRWPGGNRDEQEFLEWKKREVFKGLLEINYED